MISVTKLYSFLNNWFIAILIVTWCITVLQISLLRFHSNEILNANQELHTAIDTARINIRDDLNKISSRLDSQAEEIEIIRWRTDWIANNISESNSGTTVNTRLQLIHYIAEVEVCTGWHSSYKVKVDFYWINPRIDFNRLLIIDERYLAWAYDYNVYFPILDKNTDLAADLCSIKIISSSNK